MTAKRTFAFSFSQLQVIPQERYDVQGKIETVLKYKY